ncbi:unnamed protein product [Acanthoscelides obtectus]|uniref:Pericentrin/AKAP-450 centrosomal targeting domain-containing protein n=1 Tax=Acanthoscelides obtectus TaxID=200917 RepID=A0A9P0JYY2_ACAOB|nr:unnamed protein product [Acanthoscelides obtectus]CAK1631449.1 hypothetical protein AOBTE_LOCUS6958 [Acanthoscelides obtectus]
MDETDDNNAENGTNKILPVEEKDKESEDSLSLSLTPPLLEEHKQKNVMEAQDSISEHLNSHSNSVENDRSCHEIEISDQSNVMLNLPTEKNTCAPQDIPLDISILSDSSIISLNFLERIRNLDIGDEGKAVLEEVLSSESLKYRKDVTDSREGSLDIFANVDLDDPSLSNTKISDTGGKKEIQGSHVPNQALNNPEEPKLLTALSTELDSYKECSNTNTGSLSTTEYKQLHEECHNKLLEYDSALVYKNDLIAQLTESLDQSVAERKELLNQIYIFKEEIASLKNQVQEATQMVAQHKCTSENSRQESIQQSSADDNIKIVSNTDIEKEFASLEDCIKEDKLATFENLKQNMLSYMSENSEKNKQKFEAQLKVIKEEKQLEKEEYECEISKLRDLIANIKCGSTEIMEIKHELEALHSKELEELRTYFEKKCAELEKNYSEEVFSQQSRKMSGSTCSEAELNSDVLFSNTPGPCGDTSYNIQLNLTKKDVVNLRNELSSLLERIAKYQLDNISDDDMEKLKSEILSSNMGILLKYDLGVIRSDLQNKYHAELEVLREDHENKVDMLRLKHEDKLRTLENKYLEEINDLRIQLEEITRQNMNSSSAVQEVRLASSEYYDEEWPTELLQLRNKFTEKYEAQIAAMQLEHEEDIKRLRDEHVKVLNGALERARRRSLRDIDSLTKGDLELLRERDTLKKQVSSLRNLLGELLKYFTECEDELNNTLVDELLKQGFEKNLTQIEDELNTSTNSSSRTDTSGNVTRVHLTPNFNELLTLIESSSQGDSKDISMDLKNELECCLEKLKQEANAILTLTSNITKQQANHIVKDAGKTSVPEEQVSSLTRQLISETQAKEKLKEQLEETRRYVELLEKEKETLELELDRVIASKNMLEGDLVQTRNKLAELIENGRKEIISEGYGEEGAALRSLGDAMATLGELQDKARSLLAGSRATADPALLQLMEGLCEVGERIKEESKKDRDDLILQIEAADKKYKTTQKFLEDQAIEREQERDEAQKKIEMLMEQLKEKERDKMNYERVISEINGCNCKGTTRKAIQKVERLETQYQELTAALTEQVQKYKELEVERNEAVEKIKILREIIRELENQTENKTKEIQDLVQTVKRLEELLDQHDNSSEGKKDTSYETEAAENELRRHIEYLENELQQLRIYAELAGSEGALQKIRTELHELDVQLDRKTKDLEVLHSTDNLTCSSPSEDISARDIPRSKSPIKMDDCEVPLQQLARLKEKLIRHSRAEDAAIKRIRDLEMQVYSLKHDLEEATNEKDYMKKQIQEQLVLISDFQIRLDEQRIRAEHIEKQTNTSLETKIYDLQNDIVALREKLQNKDKLLNSQQTLLTETQERVKALEAEIESQKDDEIIVQMQRELEMLRVENAQMKDRINKEAQMVPNLVGNIISDKNTDIENLKEKLSETEKLLQSYTSLNLDPNELKALSNMKNNGTTLEQIISFLDMSHPEQVRRLDLRQDSLNSSNILPHRKQGDVTPEPEISAIAPFSLGHCKNSTEVNSKKVHFEDSESEKKNNTDNLKQQLEEKDKVIKEYEDRLKMLLNLEQKIENLQKALEETEKALANATQTFEKEQKELLDREKDLGVEIAAKKLKIEELQKKVDVLEMDSNRKDEMCLKLSKEKKELENALNSLKRNSYNSVDTVINEKNKEIDNLKFEFANVERLFQKELENKDVELLSLHSQLEDLQFRVEKLREANKCLEETLNISNSDKAKLTKELENNAKQIEKLSSDNDTFREKLNRKRKSYRDLEDVLDRKKRQISDLEEEVKKLQERLVEREENIKVISESVNGYSNEIASLKQNIAMLNNAGREEMTDKGMKLEELKKDKLHLLDLLNEKDKIINQIREDCNQLHLNLTTIKNKLKEPGTLVDLGNRLRDEQRKNAELLQQIHELKAQLMNYKTDINTVDEITDQLKRQLDYAAEIDSNIISAVSDQSLSSISETQDVELYKKALSKEKTFKKNLMAQVNKLQSQLTELQADLDKEKVISQQIQIEDAKLIEQLRIQLDVALDSGEDYKKELEGKKEMLLNLENEIEILKKKLSSCSNSKSESTEYKQLPSKEALDLCQLKKEFGCLEDERNELMVEIAALKQAKLEAENDLKHTKDMLNMEVLRCQTLEEKISEHLKKESELRDTIILKDMQIETLTYEMERDKTNLTKQKTELIELLKSRPSLGPSPPLEANSSAPISDELLNKIKELNRALLDNRKLMEHIQKLSEEKRALERELEVLKHTRGDNQPLDDLVARCDYLFGKTLKLESTKKALIWQKRYLSDYMLSHQKHCLLSNENGKVAACRNEFFKRLSPKQRFRSVVLAVTSIHRMTFLVKRWSSGARIVSKINSRHYKHLLQPTAVTSTTGAPNRGFGFQVGQPVSSQLFSATPTRTTNPFVARSEATGDMQERIISPAPSAAGGTRNESLPWFGNSPPSKEDRGVIRIGSSAFTRADMNPLRAPTLIAEFAGRIDQIQEKLGLALDSSNT